MEHRFRWQGKDYCVSLVRAPESMRAQVDGREHRLRRIPSQQGILILEIDGKLHRIPFARDSDRLHLEAARHPVVERLLPKGEFVPNDVDLDATRRQMILLTGPNMGGKSTYLRQIALAVLMAQSGWFVAAARAEIGLVDRAKMIHRMLLGRAALAGPFLVDVDHRMLQSKRKRRTALRD